ncbi:hypothetical protein [Synoicihabitans lomoniglobus]|uniref:Uncharacterized protein n=1 Tax=Synoicihabitans lomoniglobus TaxID=2909285 RepID=A0AAF0I3W5_9BACT|nr:hypothetical protein [Opitutaceae bacterium LMO-M01]WED66523.1 hypothetical protein PXH66_06630 [Opitutaceae bacterium LMO-M01]
MSGAPVIAFGQQPCGFFPRRFLVAKVWTARRLQKEMGGEIVFFYHDADHDPRETQTTLRHRTTDEAQTLNFTFENKLQRKYTPLYAKRIPADWQANTARQLGAFVSAEAIEAFKAVHATNVADFCLEMYRAMGMLEGVRVVRSSDPAVRTAACAIDDHYADVPCEGETVRARCVAGALKLHRGGSAYQTLPPCEYGPAQISPARDSRLGWMQSVIGCTHYIAGAGEQAYLRTADAPDITFVARDEIDRSSEAYVDLPV